MNHYLNHNDPHKIYPPINPAEVLEAANNSKVKAAWVMSGLPQMLANEALAAALGRPFRPTYEERVNPPENLFNFARNNNMTESGRGRQDWRSEDGDVQSAAAVCHEQAAKSHLHAAAQHQHAAAQYQQRLWRPR
jgi:hypothetical protein